MGKRRPTDKDKNTTGDSEGDGRQTITFFEPQSPPNAASASESDARPATAPGSRGASATYGQDSLNGIFDTGTPTVAVSNGSMLANSSLEADVRAIFAREEDILKKRILALEVEKVAFEEQVKRFEARNASSLSTSQTAEEQMRIVQAERRKLEKTMAADKLKRIQYEEMAAENAHIKTALEKERASRHRSDENLKIERARCAKLKAKCKEQENELEAMRSTLARRNAATSRMEDELKKLQRKLGHSEKSRADLEAKLTEVASRATEMSQEYSTALAAAMAENNAVAADQHDQRALVEEFQFVKTQMTTQMAQALEENRALQAELSQVKGVVNDLMSQLGKKKQQAENPIPKPVEADTERTMPQRDAAPAASDDGPWAGVPALADAPHLDARDLMTIDKQLNRAEKKFSSLDGGNTGLLGADEILQVAEWLWVTFKPLGAELYDETRHHMAQSLLERVESDSSRSISFDEFAAFFVRTSEAIIRYRKKVTERGGGLEGGASEKQIIAEIRVPTTAEIEALTQGTPLDAGGRYWYNYR